MKLFKDNQNNLFAYELDGSQDFLIPADFIAISKDEADRIISDKQAQLQEEIKSKLTYAQKRAAEYPPITDYLDGIVKNDQAQIDKYIADCQAVKAKYPKGVA